MPFDTNFLELMNSSIDWYPYLGEDTNGNPTYDVPVTGIPSLYVGSVTRGTTALAPTGVRGPMPEATYKIHVPPPAYMNSAVVFKPRDKIVLDNGATTFSRIVNVYQDPAEGDPGMVVIETEAYR
jgi:hypothetical protein